MFPLTLSSFKVEVSHYMIVTGRCAGKNLCPNCHTLVVSNMQTSLSWGFVNVSFKSWWEADQETSWNHLALPVPTILSSRLRTILALSPGSGFSSSLGSIVPPGVAALVP